MRRMNSINRLFLATLFIQTFVCNAQTVNQFKPDFSPPEVKQGMKLVWSEEFNYIGKPDTSSWIYENGFIRNQELHWYQAENVTCRNGVLFIEAKREKVKNPGYIAGSKKWETSREFAEYTSGSIQTRGKKSWLFGTFEIRARIDTSKGSWPAIWTMGIKGGWPACGEIDIMEFHRKAGIGIPVLRGNVGWLNTSGGAHWDNVVKPLEDFTSVDTDWVNKFHIWKMEWDSIAVKLYLDDLLINSTSLNETLNPDGKNPFLQPHYILLNLAIGSYGGDPSKTIFPVKYEVDYVRIYQKN